MKYIRIDRGGENKGIEDRVEEIGGITIEKTPPHTPQYNGRFERRFPVILSMAMAMIWSAGFTKDMKKKTFNRQFSYTILLLPLEVKHQHINCGSENHQSEN